MTSAMYIIILNAVCNLLDLKRFPLKIICISMHRAPYFIIENIYVLNEKVCEC